MSLMDTIERIPFQLKKIVENQDNISNNLESILEAHKKLKRIVLVASGTSYNAAFTTKNFAENVIGFPVEIIYPNMFVQYYNYDLLDEDNLYIFISQGGKTKLVYEGLNLVKTKGYRTISLTEKLGTPIAQLADVSLEIGSEHEEYLYRTLGYSATCATLYWLFISISKIYSKVSDNEVEAYVQDYNLMVDNLFTVKQNTFKWYRENKFQLMRKSNFIFSGTNDLWPVAQEADIKFMEMLPIFTNSFELEELIHGPQNAFDTNIGYFILSRTNENYEKADKISNFINQEISKCYLIGDNSKSDFNIAPKSKDFSSLEYITFFQVLAYLLATDKGRDLTKGIYPQVVNYINKSI
ncbi:SIS domain-containing protein [Oceanobacillus sp. FSL K6-2867]|uniref:SIS domain-containing protein n=1 Tax=Oceanobacillus sp. FSL K6-2867 TaxID=2954748 RepID=UPI0030DBBB2C